MTKAKNGDRVKVHFTGKLEDGHVFATSMNQEPFGFTIGKNEVIPGFEKAVVGMTPGESKTIKISADEAYGPHREEMVVRIDRSKLPPKLDPEVGKQLQITESDGRKTLVTVTEVSESSVTFDANFPLAGRDVIFDIQLLELL